MTILNPPLLPRAPVDPVDRLINYLFILVLIAVLILSGTTEDHIRTIIAFFLAILFSFGAFAGKYLTLGGAWAATVLGTLVVATGSWSAALLLIIFFITGSAVSFSRLNLSIENNLSPVHSIRRDGLQVWSNGFWFAFFLLFFFVLSSEVFLVAAAAALATATSDTWATELGSRRFDSPTYLIGKWEKVAAGTDGGVSIPGMISAALGSLLIAVVTIYVFSLELVTFFLIFTAGFLGCLVDSYLGARFQNHFVSVSLPVDFNFKVTNNFVNWASTGSGAVIALILNLLIL